VAYFSTDTLSQLLQDTEKFKEYFNSLEAITKLNQKKKDVLAKQERMTGMFFGYPLTECSGKYGYTNRRGKDTSGYSLAHTRI
jgi:hypothetical protein